MEENVLGIVAEYNPFHNGHLHHLEESKKITNAKYSVCVMSGNFTQRGDTGIVDKWTRANMAIENGIDLVIELPTIYSISSAENFALGAVKILNSLNLINFISFGSESGYLAILDEIATILYEEPSEYLTLLDHELSKGISFPKARENAFLMYCNSSRKFIGVLSNPNNILAIEYLKALKALKSNIVPITVKRAMTGHLDKNVVGKYASATAIRTLISENDIGNIKAVVPNNVYNKLIEKIRLGEIVYGINSFEKEILYILRTIPTDELSTLIDVSEGLENGIKKAVTTTNKLVEVLENLKSKRYTYTRLQRILLYALLDISQKDFKNVEKVKPYIRVLAMNENGKKILSNISTKRNSVDIITSVKKYSDNLKNKNLEYMLSKDILATDIYTLGYRNNSQSGLDFRTQL